MENFKDELEKIYVNGFKSEVSRIRNVIIEEAREAAKTRTYLDTKIDTNEFTSKAVIMAILHWLKGEGFEDNEITLICEEDSPIAKLHVGINWEDVYEEQESTNETNTESEPEDEAEEEPEEEAAEE